LVFFTTLLTIAIVSTAFNKDKKEFKNNYSLIPSGSFKLNNNNVIPVKFQNEQKIVYYITPYL